MRILLVEDEVELSEALVYILKKNGYQVDAVYDGIAGEDYACGGIYDAIVLDRMLPGKEGLEVLKSVRRAGVATPVMFLTAKDTVNDRVDGLEAGADDYLVKPFSNREFLARVRALTRRSLVLQNEELEYRNIRLLVEKGICLVDAEQVALTRTETQLLELFIRNRNQVLKREQILDRIWGFDRAVENANVELYVFYLRRKIDFSKAGLQLKTIRGTGYCLTEEEPGKAERG